MRQRGLDQSYIDSIIASMTAYGYTQAEIDEILAMQGYARGGRVGYAIWVVVLWIHLKQIL